MRPPFSNAHPRRHVWKSPQGTNRTSQQKMPRRTQGKTNSPVQTDCSANCSVAISAVAQTYPFPGVTQMPQHPGPGHGTAAGLLAEGAASPLTIQSKEVWLPSKYWRSLGSLPWRSALYHCSLVRWTPLQVHTSLPSIHFTVRKLRFGDWALYQRSHNLYVKKSGSSLGRTPNIL